MIEPTDIVLIAVVNHPRDMDIARVLGWYRIPLRFAPKNVRVDVLAFYQTSAFGVERWSVRYAARVRGVELTTRVNLLREAADHPRANEEYYKLQLGPVEPLPRPVPARRWKRITFLYSTGERLLAATEVNDLVIDNGEREILWKALRDRAIHTERRYDASSGEEYDLAAFCKKGGLGILFDIKEHSHTPADWRTILVDTDELQQNKQKSNGLGQARPLSTRHENTKKITEK